MSKVKITQVRSSIDRSQKQKRTLTALGLRKINGTVEHELTDTIRGMINKVAHLVKVEELDQAAATPKTASTAKAASQPKASALAATAVLEEE